MSTDFYNFFTVMLSSIFIIKALLKILVTMP